MLAGVLTDGDTLGDGDGGGEGGAVRFEGGGGGGTMMTGEGGGGDGGPGGCCRRERRPLPAGCRWSRIASYPTGSHAKLSQEPAGPGEGGGARGGG